MAGLNQNAMETELTGKLGALRLMGEPLIWINLIFRIVFLVFVLLQGNWMFGDSPHYLHFASKVCGGEWGGEAGKGPLYLWYLCLLSPRLTYPELAVVLVPPVNSSISPFVALPLLLQTLSIWLFGIFLIKKMKSKLAGIFWLFDPVLLAYSSIIMPEALFSLSVAIASLLVWKMVDMPNSIVKLKGLSLGVSLGAVSLIRTNGILMMFATMLLMAWLFLKNKLNLKQIILVCIGFCFLVAPRVYWNGTRYGHYALANQGPGWIMSVAGVVENSGSGLDFPLSEKKWLNDHPGATTQTAVKTFMNYPLQFTFLVAKGMLRVFFGHVNVEWGKLLTGDAPVGPGWWHPQESRRDGVRVSGSLIFIWVAGILLTALFSSVLYYLILKKLWALSKVDVFCVWSIALIFLQAFIPLVYGEARFRLGLWPIALILLARLYQRGGSWHLNKAQRELE